MELQHDAVEMLKKVTKKYPSMMGQQLARQALPNWRAPAPKPERRQQRPQQRLCGPMPASVGWASRLEALHGAPAMEKLRMAWLSSLLTAHAKLKWNPDMVIRLMIERNLSVRDVDALRQATSLHYDGTIDAFSHPLWIVASEGFANQFPHDAEKLGLGFIRWPEPFPPRSEWYPVWLEAKKELKIEMSEDGKISARSYLDTIVRLISGHRERKILAALYGTSAANPVEVGLQFDAFPCDNVSASHYCAADASAEAEYLNTEVLLDCFAVSIGIKENNAGLSG